MRKISFILALILALTVVFTSCNNNEEETAASTDTKAEESSSTVESNTAEETSSTNDETTTTNEEPSSTSGETTTKEEPTTSEEPTTTVEWEKNTYEYDPKSDCDEGIKSIGDLAFCGREYLVLEGTQTPSIKASNDGISHIVFDGFGALVSMATGKYAYNVQFNAQNKLQDRAGAFVRANNVATWDSGLYGNMNPSGKGEFMDAYGDAGIYYNVAKNTLYIYIKYVDPNNLEETAKVEKIVVNGVSHDITVVDLGNVIYFLSDTKTAVKISLEGEANYDVFIDGQVKKATVSTWNSDKEIVIDNPLICNDMRNSYYGFGMRSSTLSLNGFYMSSAEGVNVNDSLDETQYFVLDKDEYITTDKIGVVAKGNGTIGLYNSEGKLIMHYDVKDSAEFRFDTSDTNVKIDEQTLAKLKAGTYTVKFENEGKLIWSATILVELAGAPVSLLSAESIKAQHDAYSDKNGKTFGVTTELFDDGEYVRFTIDGTSTSHDEQVFFIDSTPVKGAKYIAIRYRTKSSKKAGELFFGTSKYPYGGPSYFDYTHYSFTYTNDGAWHDLIVDITKLDDLSSITKARLDVINGGAKTGDTIDIAWIGFFRSRADIANCGKIEMLDYKDASEGYRMTTDSYSENGTVANNGDAINWLKENRPHGIFNKDSVAFRGWVTLGKDIKIEEFGYSIDGYEPVYNQAFTQPRENELGGITNAVGYNVEIDVSSLEKGDYRVYIVARGSDGNVYNLSEWGTIIIAKDYKDPTDDLKVFSAKELYDQINKVNNPKPDADEYLKRTLADDNSYITLAVQNRCNNSHMYLTESGEFKLGNYFAYKYKKNDVGTVNEIHIQETEDGEWKTLNFQSCLATSNSVAEMDEWTIVVVDLQQFDSLYGFRLDPMNTKGTPKTDKAIDIQWMGFFNTATEAYNYNP